MSRIARVLAAAAALTFIATIPAMAQTARASITASATVVEPISLASGPSTVSSSRASIDVTTPISVRGRAAHVVQVIRASEQTPPVRSTVRGRGAETQANGATVSGYDVKLSLDPRAAASAPAAVTYVVSTLN